MPMQVMWIALVTPGGTVASDLRAVSYIGIPLAYVGAKAAGMDLAGKDAAGLASSISAMTGVIGITLFYGTAMMNLIWQHIGWARLDKGDLGIIGKVDALFPLISHFVLSFLPVTLPVSYTHLDVYKRQVMRHLKIYHIQLRSSLIRLRI